MCIQCQKITIRTTTITKSYYAKKDPDLRLCVFQVQHEGLQSGFSPLKLCPLPSKPNCPIQLELPIHLFLFYLNM